ncbi:MAG: hypothetical protein QXI84_09215 [Thermofilaceae archaeon]
MVLVEIRDRSLVERLKSLLPRPDAPLDVAIAHLLEQCAKRGDKARELGDVVADKVAARLEKALERLPDLVAEAVRNELEALTQPARGWDAVVEAMKRSGGCLTFKQIERLYGKSINSEALRKRGLVSKKRGVWCLPNGT